MPSAYRGHAGLRQWAADLREAWEFLDHRPLELADAGERFAFLCKIRLRARRSRIELDSYAGQVFWVRGGLIVRELDLDDWDEAIRLVSSPEKAEGRGRRQPAVTSSR
jgi:hypothetical protein